MSDTNPIPNPTPTQIRFIELRAKGWSYFRISDEIKITKPTLIVWGRKFETQINNYRSMLNELRQEKFLASEDDRLKGLSKSLARIEAELAFRDLASVPTGQLFNLAATLRRQILQATESTPLDLSVIPLPPDAETAAAASPALPHQPPPGIALPKPSEDSPSPSGGEISPNQPTRIEPMNHENSNASGVRQSDSLSSIPNGGEGRGEEALRFERQVHGEGALRFERQVQTENRTEGASAQHHPSSS